ncbi:MAG: DUF2207 domain-containing protein [Desulfovibrionales bacterium]|nr:DUF2207 domain-containing protein [Desulfovibrionales bacterium]
MLPRRIVLFALLALLTAASPLGAETERILDFSSTVIVNADSSLLVSETITVLATGDQIKRGIVREFPTVYTTSSGQTVRVGFDLVDVHRDGHAEPYHTEDRINGVAIYVGDKNVFLSPGSYTYTLVYKTTRQLGFFENYDELYWNVNGNGWRLPLDKVSCEVHLPDGAKVLEAVSYEGPQGSTESRRFKGGESSITMASSRPYGLGEGLTIAVSWPKGFVTPPTASELAKGYVSGRGALVPAVGGGALLLLYYVLAWLKVGRDPAKGVIIPRFEPPKGFSPAMVRMLWSMKFDNTAFTAGIVNMAVKGGLVIREDDQMRLELAKQPPARLSAGEKAAWDELRKAGGSIVLKNTNHQVLNRARQVMKDKLHKELAQNYFVTNSGWVAPGVVITLATVAAMAWTAPEPMALLFISVWLTGWTFGCSLLLRQAWRAWQARGVMGKVSALFLSLFSIPFLTGEVAGLSFFGMQAGLPPTFVFLVMVLMNALFYELLKAPTRIGRQVLDEIEGLRAYLSVAEEDRLNFIHPPEETPELFEKFLPYAMALGVENEWGERFAGILSRAGYAPGWYAGPLWSHMHPGGFASGLSSGISSSVSSASAAPGSSSGTSGGGSSGGGGGGGGGGGW